MEMTVWNKEVKHKRTITSSLHPFMDKTGLCSLFNFIFSQLVVRGYSSVVEHLTADQEVSGSIPDAPSSLVGGSASFWN